MATIDRAPINRLPAGLLGFIDVKAMGKNPAFFGDVVSPVVDLTPFYRSASRFRVISTNIVPTGAFTNVSNIVVPDGKVWLIENILATSAGLTATAQLSGAVCIVSPNSTGVLACAMPGQYQVAGDGGVLSSWYHPVPYVALPGYRFGINFQRFAAPGPNCNIEVVGIEVDF